jgi:hypothetical protein
VWAVGLKGTFVIVTVDRSKRCADLESIDNQKAEKNVSFDVINPVGGDIRQSGFR